MDELVWLRLLKLVFGNTVYAATVVVSVFMGGLALGSLVMGKYALRIKHPLRLYSQLEIVISLTALLMPVALRGADLIYRGLWPSLHATNASSTGLLAVQFCISALLLLVPTFLMGASFPLLGRYVNEQEENAGHSIGGLYAANTFGAFAGCLLAGFILIRFLGLHVTLCTAVILNFAVAAAAWRLSAQEVGKPLPASPRVDQAPRQTGALPLFLPVVFFVSGLASISYEVIWLQSVIYIAGHSTYVFSGVLLVYLLGNVIGAAAAGRLSLVVRRPVAALVLSLLAVGVFGVLHVLWQDHWASILSQYVRPVYCGPERLGGFRAVGMSLLNCFALFLPAAIAMGAGYPFALQAWRETGRGGGRTAGTVAGLNTAGGVLGGVVTTFCLLPCLGLQRSVYAVSLLVIFLAYALWLVCQWRSSIVKKCLAAIVPIAVTLHVCLVPGDLFYDQFRSSSPGTELIHVREGIGTAVSVHQKGNDRILALGGAHMSGDDRPEGHMLHGHLGPLLSANIERAMCVGFGTGITTSSVAKHDIDEIDIIERHPEVLETALDFFPRFNGAPLPKKMTVYHLDARNYAHISDKSYDLIVTDANAPKRWANSGELYTVEYFDKVRRLLRPGGKHILWLPLWLPPDCIDSILGSFMKVFPYTTLWHQMQSDLPFFYVVGSNDPQSFSPDLIDRALSNAKARPHLQAIFLRSSKDVFINYFADEQDLKPFLANYEINSDWSPFIEFNTGEEVIDSHKTLLRFSSKRDFDSLVRHLDLSGFSEPEKRTLLESYRKAFLFFETVIKARSTGNPIEGLLCLIDAEAAGADYPFLKFDVISKGEQAALWIRWMIDHGREAEISGSLNLLRSRYPRIAAGLLNEQ